MKVFLKWLQTAILEAKDGLKQASFEQAMHWF
jgi:hypothetical protein